jgi:hypothetical protein
MHNDPMISRLIGLSVATVVAAAGLAGCSGGDDGSPESSGSSSPDTPSAVSTSTTPYLPVPYGVELTVPGSQLSVGDRATVAYQPRQDEVGVLDIAVTGLQRTSIAKSFSAWRLSDEQEKSNPYFVRATVENVGDTDLGGRAVPLYVVNDENLLLESTPFASSFEGCPSTPLPEKFGPGERAKVCLVYLAPDHGDLVAVSFRPEETFNPITWTGRIEKYAPPEPGRSEGKKGKGEKKDG